MTDYNPQPLVAYLIGCGGFEAQELSWPQLAEKFEIVTGEAAFNRWKRFLGSERGIEFKKANLNSNGEIVGYTMGRSNDDRKPDLEGAEWYEHTTGPQGGGWTKFRRTVGYGFTDYEVAQVTERLSGEKFSARQLAKASGTGIADLSDLHAGAVLKYAIETIKTLPFDITTLTSYLDEAASIINSYKFRETHLFLPGDIVETFTAFNHRDTWKNVQMFQGGVTIVAYQVLKRFLSSVNNLKRVYMVEGNHDRLTADKEGNSRKGIVELMAFFLQENGNVEVLYHPWMVRAEIDGVYHLCTHGDHKPFLKNDFWFRYGRQGMYNVLRTGHYHGFNVLRQTQENLHYQCPSVFTGNFFSESIGFDCVPGMTVVRHKQGMPMIDYIPLSIGNIFPEKTEEVLEFV